MTTKPLPDLVLRIAGIEVGPMPRKDLAEIVLLTTERQRVVLQIDRRPAKALAAASLMAWHILDPEAARNPGKPERMN